LGEDIEVVLTLASDLGHVLVDAGQVEQVLMNLVLNARDAMTSGGRLSITTRNTTLTADARGNRGLVPPGSYAVLVVADTGAGMDAATKAHLFEPFFTTKGVGKGTGLGLSTVHGIVSQSGGYVAVESAPGKGATFTVYFPVVAADTATAPSRSAETRAAKGIETVLLVEDNPSVRQIVKRILVDEGYHVLEAGDGQAALEVSASYDRPIDAVITDAVMPGMTGVAVLDRIRSARPLCRGILMSGHTDDEITRRGISAKDVTFIQKPFTPADFARQVRQALDA
jgi:CheY-like chemotaxis protein